MNCKVITSKNTKEKKCLLLSTLKSGNVMKQYVSKEIETSIKKAMTTGYQFTPGRMLSRFTMKNPIKRPGKSNSLLGRPKVEPSEIKKYPGSSFV